MIRRWVKTGLWVRLLLVAMIFIGQLGASAHAAQNEQGSQHNPACAACVTARQLDLACVDHAVTVEIPTFGSPLYIAEDFTTAASDIMAPWQRGPPSSR